MPTNPALAQAIAAHRAAVAERGGLPGGEHALVDGTAKAAVREMPDIDPAVIGEVLIHTVRLMDAIVEKVRELDPMLDWESTKDIALNMLTHAGARLYEAGV